MKTRRKKQGSFLIPVGILLLIIILFVTFLVYYQVNIIVTSVKNDLFYAANDAILSFDVQDLAYKKYTIDKAKTKEIIEYILNKNYVEAGESIKKVKVTSLNIVQSVEYVTLDVEVQVTFESVINLSGKTEHNFKIKENIKIALLKYEMGE